MPALPMLQAEVLSIHASPPNTSWLCAMCKQAGGLDKPVTRRPVGALSLVGERYDQADVPFDALGECRPITLESGVAIGTFAVVHGGTTLGRDAQVEDHAVVGQPELGYAVGHVYSGAGGSTTIGAGVVLRAGVVCYAEVRVGENAVVGHRTLLRTGVQIGAEAQLGHQLTVERAAQVGQGVRCSPGSHITSAAYIGDGVFLGAGVLTVNDNRLIWREPGRRAVLAAPRFEAGAKVGSGSVVLAGVTIGEHALVGAGSLVTRDVPARALAYGHPARVRGAVR